MKDYYNQRAKELFSKLFNVFGSIPQELQKGYSES